MNVVQKVIAIDGPSASGKGTIAAKLAKKLGFAYLDSGALYRLCALAAKNSNLSWSDEAALVTMAQNLCVRFGEHSIFLDDKEVTLDIRQEEIGLGASKIARLPLLREALLTRQRAFLTELGLVADGRDMGSVVFPNAVLKVFLTASAGVRAERRFLQLQNLAKEADYDAILADIEARDFADEHRQIAPLKHYPDACSLDTSEKGIEETVEKVYQWYLTKINR